MNSKIPVFSLEGSGINSFDIHHIAAALDHSDIIAPHRDTNFILIFHQSGTCELVVDFKKIQTTGPSVFTILPGQIHHGVGLLDINAWIIAIDGALFEPAVRQLFIESSIHYRPIALEKNEAKFLERSLQLLQDFRDQPLNKAFEDVQRKMLDTCIALFAAVYRQLPAPVSKGDLRPWIITRSFWGLLLQSFRTIKSPSAYASALNISPSYLNEVVKDTTGFPVSYWIQQEIVMEAKRLLYYTNNTVKEIAINLGYQDTAYFIRFFRKCAGESPLKFREKSHQQYPGFV